MQCPRCQHENPSQAKFCLECGARVALTCTKCRSELPAGAKFCLECGEPVASQATAEPRFTSPESYTPKHLKEKILTSKAALEGERKQVTVLFADLKGSMELLADRDPEEARKILDPVLEHMMEAVHRYEGTVNQVMGDGIMALFGAPLAHEDHAVRACYAALRMQETVKRYAEEVRRTQGISVRIRIGLNSGDVVVRAVGSDLRMDYTAVGQTTHLAARMEQLADPGATLLTPDTLVLAEGHIEVRPLGPMPVKGLADPVEVYEMLGANRDKLVELAAKTKLPAMYLARGFVDAGGLLSYGSSSLKHWRLAATYVDKILKGAKPADLPVEQATEFELVINLKTAKALGLTIPPVAAPAGGPGDPVIMSAALTHAVMKMSYHRAAAGRTTSPLLGTR